MILRVGIAGLGVGAAHLSAYARLPDQFKVQALCDMDEPKAVEAGNKYAVESVTTDFARLCDRKDLDVIDVCTPSHLHVEQIKKAIASGKHVICEKPVAGSLRDADALVQAEANSGSRVMPIFQYRFGASVQMLKLLVERGAAGRAYLATSETSWRRGPDYYRLPWRGRWETELGGPLVTLAIHSLDLVQYIVGPARNAFAYAATRVNPIETEDCLTASICMADGSLCALSVTTGSAEEISRLRFCFEGLSAEGGPNAYQYAQDPWRFTGNGEKNARAVQDILASYVAGPEGYVGQFARFHKALAEDAELPVTLAQARSSLELIAAIYHSAHTGQAVDLPIGPSRPEYSNWRPLEKMARER